MKTKVAAGGLSAMLGIFLTSLSANADGWLPGMLRGPSSTTTITESELRGHYNQIGKPLNSVMCPSGFDDKGNPAQGLGTFAVRLCQNNSGQELRFVSKDNGASISEFVYSIVNKDRGCSEKSMRQMFPISSAAKVGCKDTSICMAEGKNGKAPVEARVLYSWANSGLAVNLTCMQDNTGTLYSFHIGPNRH